MGELTDLIFTIISKLGRWYNVKGEKVCFLIWSFVMVYWIFRNWEMDLKVQTGGCVFSLVMHLYGWYSWNKKGM